MKSETRKTQFLLPNPVNFNIYTIFSLQFGFIHFRRFDIVRMVLAVTHNRCQISMIQTVGNETRRGQKETENDSCRC